MDIRDFNIKVLYPENHALEDLFGLQKTLLSHYIGIEGLPQYPIDIHTKQGQSIIKDFSGRIIEELGEGWESYTHMLDLFTHGINDPIVMKQHLQNFNEEIADAIHFWLELLIYSGIEPKNIYTWVTDVYHIAEPPVDVSDILALLMYHASNLNTLETQFEKFPAHYVIRDKDVKDEFLRGGRAISNRIYEHGKMLLWDITYHLQIARNTLKNKPWKQTQMMTDTKVYEKHLCNHFMAMFKFFAFFGFTPLSLYTIYYNKNQVNQFRIKSKY